MTVDSKAVILDLLYGALIEIRVWSSPATTTPEADHEFINQLANLTHNWPTRLKEANTPDDYDQLLCEFWMRRDRRTDPWMHDRLALLGVDATTLEGPSRT